MSPGFLHTVLDSGLSVTPLVLLGARSIEFILKDMKPTFGIYLSIIFVKHSMQDFNLTQTKKIN